jgi:hypothetical protein
MLAAGGGCKRSAEAGRRTVGTECGVPAGGLRVGFGYQIILRLGERQRSPESAMDSHQDRLGRVIRIDGRVSEQQSYASMLVRIPP